MTIISYFIENKVKKIHIITLFDKNYLIRALTMKESILYFYQNIQFWFLCLDTESKNMIEEIKMDMVKAITLDNIGDERLLKTKIHRNNAEFAFTAKSVLIDYIINSSEVKESEVVMWVDSDILFYSSPVDILNEMEKYSIAITPHKFPDKNIELEKKVGRYNAGLIFFKVDNNSKKCINEWKNQCIDWCFLKYEDGKLGDQMYLDSWTKKYNAVYEIPDKGINLGSWNVERYKVSSKSPEQIFIDNNPLVCYHFHGVKMYKDKENSVHFLPINIINKNIFDKYSKKIKETWKLVLLFDKKWAYGFIEKPSFVRLLKQKIYRNFQKINSYD